MNSDTFDPTRLSARETEILEAATEGMTDIQIAQRMDITQSTVNSYWVRIRGKLGQLSRTELVALLLKQKARFEMSEATTLIETLQREALIHAKLTLDYTNAETLRGALDAMPDAVLVCCVLGIVRYANSRLEAMFGYEEGTLTGELVVNLLPASQREVERERLMRYFEAPRPIRIGLDKVVYGQRKDGRLIRIVMLVDWRPTSTGPIFTCIVRDFVSEIETRKVYNSAWT